MFNFSEDLTFAGFVKPPKKLKNKDNRPICPDCGFVMVKFAQPSDDDKVIYRGWLCDCNLDKP